MTAGGAQGIKSCFADAKLMKALPSGSSFGAPQLSAAVFRMRWTPIRRGLSLVSCSFVRAIRGGRCKNATASAVICSRFRVCGSLTQPAELSRLFVQLTQAHNELSRVDDGQLGLATIESSKAEEVAVMCRSHQGMERGNSGGAFRPLWRRQRWSRPDLPWAHQSGFELIAG